MGARFPFVTYPRGWFVVGFATDVAAGAVKTVHHFGVDIVLFRTESGKLAAIDRTCPHLGAHLGVGWVDGECLRCPLHAWGFDGTGRCVDVPGVPRIPKKASVSAWPVREIDGLVLVYHCPRGEAPTWEPPTLGSDGWTADRTMQWQLRSHPQEVAEGVVDGHGRHAVAELDGHVLQVRGADDAGETVVTLHGLGMVVSTIHARATDLRTRRGIYATPIDETRIAVFAVHNTATADAARDEAAFAGFIAEFSRDFPIWETKAYLERPLLVGDGPIGRFREWAGQFYDARPAAEVGAGEAVSEQRGAQVRLGEWLRKVVKPVDEAAVDEDASEPDAADEQGPSDRVVH